MYNGGADIAFLLDSSESVTPFNYQNEKVFVIDVMMAVVKNSSQFRAAVLAYSSNVYAGLNFSDKFKLHQFNSIVNDLPHLQKNTRMDKALLYASDHFFTDLAGRPDVPKIAVLITDGRNSMYEADAVPPSDASVTLKMKGVRILVVGVMGLLDIDELLDITVFRDDLLVVDGFFSLSDFVGDMVNVVTSAIGKVEIPNRPFHLRVYSIVLFS